MKQDLLHLGYNLSQINKIIEQSCAVIHKNPQDIKLIAVSKNQPFELIKQAYDLGIRDFGESYAQELKNKINLAEQAGLAIRWHFIGAIQTNKIKDIARAEFIHSISNIRHAEVLDKIAEHEVKIFLQIKLIDDQSRSGFLVSDMSDALLVIKKLNKLKIIGLMAILPLDTQKKPEQWFAYMRELRDNLDPELKLSMGMSSDFKEAILAGADYIRIGSLLFGPRY